MGENTDKLIESTEQYYKSLAKFYHPKLKIWIYFNRHGWHHIFYKTNGHKRNLNSIRLRLHLIHKIRQVLSDKQQVITSETQALINQKVTYISLSSNMC